MNRCVMTVIKKTQQNENNIHKIMERHKNQSDKNMYTSDKQSKMESQRNVAYIKKIIKKKKRNRHQHNTDDGGQAMGEEMRHVQGVSQLLKQSSSF